MLSATVALALSLAGAYLIARWPARLSSAGVGWAARAGDTGRLAAATHLAGEVLDEAAIESRNSFAPGGGPNFLAGRTTTRLNCHTPFRMVGVMEIEYRTRFSCLWCGETFARRSHTGRKPSYCSSSHRQRSYEARRRDLHRSHHPAPPPRRPAPRPAWPPSTLPTLDYPAGKHFDGRIKTVIQALRNDGPPDPAGRYLTLCGTWARHENRPYRQAVRSGMEHHDRCATCLQLADQFPSPHTTDHFGDLTRIRSHLARRRRCRNEPWLRQLIDECFPATPVLRIQAPIA